MAGRNWRELGWVPVWGLLIATALATRPLLPVDETRYVAAAWEMWLRSDFLVPHLNGAPYSHKPPLLFWSIHAGWSLFGVNEWWPRLVSPLAGLAAIFATRCVARLLWPGRADIAAIVPWLLLGGFFWSLFTTVTMFDMWNALLAAAGVGGIVMAVRGRRLAGFAALGLAIGLGVLAKGPVILLYTLPVALAVHWWAPAAYRPNLHYWFAGLAAGIGLGAAIARAWALPAASAGGEAYGNAIFWGQTAGRVEDSFAHGRPWWWYLPLLPAMLLPWAVWPPLWRGGIAWPGRFDWQIRLAIVWFLPAFVAFSLISGKQPHYMIPLLPPLALMAAHRLADVRWIGDHDGRFPGLVWILLGGVLSLLPIAVINSPELIRLPSWAADVSPIMGGVLALAGALVAVTRSRAVMQRVMTLGLLSPLAVILIHVFVMTKAAPAYDLTAVSQHIAKLQKAGPPVAVGGKYHGQFHFLGRLTQPLHVVPYGAVQEWSRTHPGGRFVALYRPRHPVVGAPEFRQPYRGRTLEIWNWAGIAANSMNLK